MRTLGKFKLNEIYKGDCVSLLKELPSSSVDLVIADPPYNLGKGGDWSWDPANKLPGFGGSWQKRMESWDDMTLGDYFDFSLAWLAEVKRVVKPTGSFWVHGTYHNIGIINYALQCLDIEIINEVIWYKRNSFPNLSGRRLTASHESILWAHTGGAKKRKYLFNYDASKDQAYEYDQLKSLGKQMRTVWDIPNNKEKNELAFGAHPTQKPLRLIRRMLDISAGKDFICLSPFAGSGSDCVAFAERGLKFLGMEVKDEYVELANARLCKITKQSKSKVGENQPEMI